MNFTVVHEDGEWVCSRSPFPLFDQEQKLRFAPGVLYKVQVPDGSWLAGQIQAGAFARAEGPNGEPVAAKPEPPPKPQGPPNQPMKPGAVGKAAG